MNDDDILSVSRFKSSILKGVTCLPGVCDMELRGHARAGIEKNRKLRWDVWASREQERTCIGWDRIGGGHAWVEKNIERACMGGVE